VALDSVDYPAGGSATDCPRAKRGEQQRLTVWGVIRQEMSRKTGVDPVDTSRGLAPEPKRQMTDIQNDLAIGNG